VIGRTALMSWAEARKMLRVQYPRCVRLSPGGEWSNTAVLSGSIARSGFETAKQKDRPKAAFLHR
jgi:hypothetical protein